MRYFGKIFGIISGVFLCALFSHNPAAADITFHPDAEMQRVLGLPDTPLQLVHIADRPDRGFTAEEARRHAPDLGSVPGLSEALGKLLGGGGGGS